MKSAFTLIGLALLMMSCGPAHKPTKAIARGGQSNLALLVGIDDYAADIIPDLEGAANDVADMKLLLTGTDGFNFPADRVYTLVNEAATRAAFRDAFQKKLVDQAGPDDVVVIFFAGYGSHVPDLNGDEPDGRDETLVFHDSRVNGAPDLIDDDLHSMLSRLQKKAKQVVLILDSGFSASATRGANLPRNLDPPNTRMSPESPPIIPGSEAWLSSSLPGLILIGAATENTTAREIDGHGVLTRALLQAWSEPETRPLTYAGTEARVRRYVKAASSQIPFFEGELDRLLFGDGKRSTPISWRVRSIGADRNETGEVKIELGGPPIPGMGEGAELRVYDEKVGPEAYKDPRRAKAQLIVHRTTGLNAIAKIDHQTKGAAPIQPGDLAVLVRPGDGAVRVRVHIRANDQPDGVPNHAQALLKQVVAAKLETRLMVEWADQDWDLEVTRTPTGHFQIRDDQGRTLTTFDQPPEHLPRVTPQAGAEALGRSLQHHAAIKALLRLKGDGGVYYEDDHSLKIQLVPVIGHKEACFTGGWEQAQANKPQDVPYCHAYNLKVTVSEDCPEPLLISGLFLSSSGDIFPIPDKEPAPLLKAGESYTFTDHYDTYMGAEPFLVEDRILVFGVQAHNQVPWHQLGSAGEGLRFADVPSPLFHALNRYLSPGGRLKRTLERPEDSLWTLSSIPIRVIPPEKK